MPSHIHEESGQARVCKELIYNGSSYEASLEVIWCHENQDDPLRAYSPEAVPLSFVSAFKHKKAVSNTNKCIDLTVFPYMGNTEKPQK